MDFLQDVILSQWLILTALAIVFLIVSRWALVVFEEYPGYILGWLIGLFFIIVRLSVGEANRPENANIYLDGFQVFAATLFGLGVGTLIVVALRFAMRIPQAISIQVAVYTALVIILFFNVLIGTSVAQKMIGIFGISIGIATLFAMVLFPTAQHKEKLNIKAQGISGTQQVPAQNPPPNNNNSNYGSGYNPQSNTPGQGGGQPQPGQKSRLDKIRESSNTDRKYRK